MLLKDPVNTIGGIGQSICDTADEKGVAYSSGYIVTEVVTALLADKGLDKLKNVAKSGKTADNVADIAEGAAKAAGNAAEDAGKAGKGLEGAAKGAESAAEDAGKVVEGGSASVIKTQKNVTAPILPEGSQWERNVLNSFAGGKSSPVTYKGGTTLYRVGGKNGGFWSLDPPPATEYQWRVNTAIKQEFCNDGTTLYKMTIPEGSSLAGLEGKVGSQGMGLYGGAHQVYIDYRAVPADWIEISPTTWK